MSKVHKALRQDPIFFWPSGRALRQDPDEFLLRAATTTDPIRSAIGSRVNTRTGPWPARIEVEESTTGSVIRWPIHGGERLPADLPRMLDDLADPVEAAVQMDSPGGVV